MVKGWTVADVNPVYEDFSTFGSRWRRHVVGVGTLEDTGSTLRFITERASSREYANAQIDDYQGLPRRQFLWQPPLRLTVRARFSHPAGSSQHVPWHTTKDENLPVAQPSPSPSLSPKGGESVPSPLGERVRVRGDFRSREAGLRGTAGFGFWNDPFLMTGARVPTLPRAVWFFYASPPSNIKLDLDIPGHSWKAATIDALRPIALLLAPIALPAVLLMNIQSWYRRLWPSIQQAINVREALVPVDMTAWHTYSLTWGAQRTRFYVSNGGESTDMLLLEASSPRGPLGFVMWLDNQYMIVTPQGRLDWGLLDVTGRQWMEVDMLSIEPW